MRNLGLKEKIRENFSIKKRKNLAGLPFPRLGLRMLIFSLQGRKIINQKFPYALKNKVIIIF